MLKTITEAELMPEIDPMEVVRCVQGFQFMGSDKLLTIKYSIRLSDTERLYNSMVILRAIDEVLKSRSK